MKKKIYKLTIFRTIIQIIFLILLPGLFTLAFSEIKLIYTMLLKGNFDFVQAFPRLVVAAAIIPITIVFGRFFCGWICSFGFLNDFVYTIAHKAFKINFKINEKMDKVLKYLKYIILAFIIYFMWSNTSSIFATASPWDAFAQITNFPQVIMDYTFGFALLVLITLGSLFVERFFCRYLCPIGGILTIISRFRIFNINKPSAKCSTCRICTTNCSMGIELWKMDKVNTGECINCLKCIEVCPRKNTSAVILGEKVSPALASAITIAGFTGLYAAANVLGNNISSNLNLASNSGSSGSVTSGTKATTGKYIDGTYTGSGTGYKRGLTVSVTIKNGNISKIQVLTIYDTKGYYETPVNVIPQEIIKSQSTNVDAVSGATRTSEGIMTAVADALSQAI